MLLLQKCTVILCITVIWSHLLFRELVSLPTPNQAIFSNSILEMYNYIVHGKTCIEFCKNIKKVWQLLLWDLLSNYVLIRLFLVLFLQKCTIVLCLVIVNYKRNHRKHFQIFTTTHQEFNSGRQYKLNYFWYFDGGRGVQFCTTRCIFNFTRRKYFFESLNNLRLLSV